jgi:hypothetical protein
LRWGLEVALRIRGKKPAGVGENTVMTQASKDIQNFSLFGQRVASAVCGQQWETENPREVDGSLIAAFFFAPKMALQLNVHIFFAENRAQVAEECRCRFHTVLTKCMVE